MKKHHLTRHLASWRQYILAALILATTPSQAETGKLLTITSGTSSMTKNLSYSSTVSVTDYALVYVSDTGRLESVNYDISLNVTYSYKTAACSAIKIYGANASMGDLEEGSTITVNTSSTSSSLINYVYGIYCQNGSVGDINGDLIVTTTQSTSAYAIHLSGDTSSIGVIRGSITCSVDSTDHSAYGIRYYNSSTSKELTFGAGAEIITIRGDSVGTAISNSKGFTLNVENYCASSEAVTLYGSLYAAYGDIYFESGNYNVTSASWSSSSVIFSQNSSVFLTGNPDSSSTSFGRISGSTDLVFEIEHVVDGAILTIAEDSYFNALNSVTVQLSDEMYAQYCDLISAEDWDAIDLNIIAASGDISIACLEDTEFSITNEDGSITYASGLSYSDCNFVTSISSGGDGTDTDFDVVPEPTTATLSLLALSALLARRRRTVKSTAHPRF